MNSLQQPIGILGGTFDPIHFGHLRAALEIYQAARLSEVRVIPCYQPVHRQFPIATPAQRFEMVQCALQGQTALIADDSEILRKAPSYMIDTLEALNKKMPAAPLCLIMGIDAFLGFPSWHRYKDILTIAHLIIVHRPNYQLPTNGILSDLLKQRLKVNITDVHSCLAGNIILHPVTSLEISASEIRKQISIGKNPRYLLPDSVYDYVQRHGIYSLSRL